MDDSGFFRRCCGMQMTDSLSLPPFLVDAYRNKMRSTMVAGGQEVSTVAPHFETRVGKRKWLEKERKSKRANTP